MEVASLWYFTRMECLKRKLVPLSVTHILLHHTLNELCCESHSNEHAFLEVIDINIPSSHDLNGVIFIYMYVYWQGARLCERG